MRFLTPEEQRLLGSLPDGERDVLQAFFDETDARLVMGLRAGDAVRSETVGAVAEETAFTAGGKALAPPSRAPEGSQDALFSMHKKEARP